MQSAGFVAKAAAPVDRAPDVAAQGAQPQRGPAIGNQAALRRLERGGPRSRMLQRKLEVGAVDDPLEHEADAVADRVMRMADPGVAVARAPAMVRRKCAACEEQEKVQRAPTAQPIVRRKCAACEEEEKVQKKGAGTNGAAQAPPMVHATLRSSGRPLDPAARAFFEPRFGRDFGAVRVHDDTAAAASARSVDAVAYTVGHDIVFAQGRYAPDTPPGRQLLAHELAHVVQQNGGASRGGPLRRQSATSEAAPEASPSPLGASGAPPARKTIFTPGEMHDHQPSGKWSEIQKDPQSGPKESLACSLMDPATVMQVAAVAELGDKPIALKHLNWFLQDGSGKDFLEDVNLEQMLRTDAGIQRLLAGKISSAPAGHFGVDQHDYADQNFRDAFGNIDRMDYEVDTSTRSVHVWFQDRYEWHPVYPGLYSEFPSDTAAVGGMARPSNCVHAAAVELKAGKARDFWMKGETTVSLSVINIPQTAPGPQAPTSPAPETPAEPSPNSTQSPTPAPDPMPVSPPEPGGLPAGTLNAGYTQCDFLDDNISTEAQRALYALYKRDGDSRNDALRMLGAVRSGQMQGVYKEDEQTPAVIAARHGGSWWTAVPPGQGAVVSEVEPPPIAVFRNAVASDREQLADALDAAWLRSPLAQETIAIPPPSGKECPLIPPPPHDEPTPEDTPADPLPDSLPLCIDQVDWDSRFTALQDQCFGAVASIAAICAASNASATPPNIGKDIEERILAIAQAALGLKSTGCEGYVWTVGPHNPLEPGVEEKIRQLTTQRVEECVVGVNCAGMKETERAELARDPRRCDPWISASRSECEEIRQRYRKWLAKH